MSTSKVMQRKYFKMTTLILSLCFSFILIWQKCEAKNRVYYIGAIDVDWDYAPSGFNLKNGQPVDKDPDASVFTKNGTNRIGRVYRKTVYREFIDNKYVTKKAHRKDLGILGPVIRGEVGDVITIHFKNMGKRPYTMHPHGVFYKKSSEGAKYLDNTSGDMKKDDGVKPGETHKYEWLVREEDAPKEGDEPCIAWLYHSHETPSKDINTGLVGILLTCKKGSLDLKDKRKDVHKEVFLLFNVFDENKSWFLDENIKSRTSSPKSVDKEDDGFKESNLLHGINGIFYGNLDGFDFCIGEKVAWHMAVLGNEVDMHTISYAGNMMLFDNHRTDSVSLFPAQTATAVMDIKNPGKWMLSCQVADHYSGGMFTFYNIKQCGGSKKPAPIYPAPGGRVLEYFIAAKEVEWNYAPSEMNHYEGGLLNKSGSSSETFFVKGSNRIGGKYLKALYYEYSNSSFTIMKQQDPYLGFLGPVIKAEVGDTIKVTFRNMASRNFSIHPRGVLYDKNNEGSFYRDNENQKGGDQVALNATYTYTWYVPESVAPTSSDWTCISWLYTSGVDPVKDVYSGLFGPLVICKNGTLQKNGVPKGYAAEKFIILAVMDENKSWYLDRNMEQHCTVKKCNNVNKEDEDFMESNKMHQINGFMYGNLKGLEMCKDEKVLWHAYVIGTEVDMHGIYFHGNSFSSDFEVHKDSLALFPGEGTTFSMNPSNEGTWGLVCRVNDHFNAGMKATYTVNKCNSSSSETTSGTKRKFYIGIIEKEWDYAMSNKSMLHGFDLDTNEHSKVFTQRSQNRIGKVYKKAMYREFTDDTFTKEKERNANMKHLGILGPLIRAEEGDQIEIVLKNMGTRNYSIQPHGVSYSKENEGSVYLDHTSKQHGKYVAPVETFTYKWFVPQRSSPGLKDSACVTWAYYSSVDAVKDTNTGLIGPLITCRKGTLDKKGERKDVDKEFALLFTVLDENESWFLDDNVNKYANKSKVDKTDDGFKESNKMHAINGYIYGNGPNNGNHLQMKSGEKIAWYLLGLGNEVDIHTVHFHANNFIYKTTSNHLDDVYDVFPGIFQSLEMTPTNPGTWLLHCHVHDHLEGGMETRYTVVADLSPKPSNAAGKHFLGHFSVLISVFSVIHLII